MCSWWYCSCVEQEYLIEERFLLIYIFTGLFFELGGTRYLNNTVILVDEIGVGDRALLCRTNNTGCCRNPSRGEFYYPNSNNTVQTAGVSPSFYRNRGTGFIRLNRQPNTDIPLVSTDARYQMTKVFHKTSLSILVSQSAIRTNNYHLINTTYILFLSVQNTSQSCPTLFE